MEEDDIQAIRDATIVVTVDVSEEEEVNMVLYLEFDCPSVGHIVYNPGVVKSLYSCTRAQSYHKSIP